MRTTLTLDDDVAAVLERVRRERRISLKDAVNRAMRLGLEQLDRRQLAQRPRYRIRVSETGCMLLPDVDDVQGVLDQVDPDTLP